MTYTKVYPEQDPSSNAHVSLEVSTSDKKKKKNKERGFSTFESVK